MAKQKGRQAVSSRRKFIKSSAAVAAGATMFGAHAVPTKAPARPRHMDPDLILINGKIHTMDANGSIVSSVAIKDGRIIATASGRGQPMLPGRETRVIDLGGRTVVPGIIDNHNHIVLMGNRPAITRRSRTRIRSRKSQETLRRACEGNPGRRMDHHHRRVPLQSSRQPGRPRRRLPKLEELDAAAPNNPVYLQVSFSGPCDHQQPGQGVLEAQGDHGRSADGAIAAGTQTGMALLALRQTLLNPEARRRGVIDAMEYGREHGRDDAPRSGRVPGHQHPDRRRGA